jgi:hypothetical protein
MGWRKMRSRKQWKEPNKKGGEEEEANEKNTNRTEKEQ